MCSKTFTISLERTAAENSLQRYESGKQRNKRKELLRQEEESEKSSSLTTADIPVEYLPQQVSIGTQLDLTAASIRALEADYQQQVSESAQVVTKIKGFPDQEDFKVMKTLSTGSTGLGNFTVLIAVFILEAPAISDHPLSKLSKFQSFTLTSMKLRLNAANFDLAFRFGVSSTTVNGYCQDGLK